MKKTWCKWFVCGHLLLGCFRFCFCFRFCCYGRFWGLMKYLLNRLVRFWELVLVMTKKAYLHYRRCSVYLWLREYFRNPYNDSARPSYGHRYIHTVLRYFPFLFDYYLLFISYVYSLDSCSDGNGYEISQKTSKGIMDYIIGLTKSPFGGKLWYLDYGWQDCPCHNSLACWVTSQYPCQQHSDGHEQDNIETDFYQVLGIVGLVPYVTVVPEWS